MRQHRDNRSAGEMHAARRLVHTVGFGAQRRRKYSERQMRNGRDENVSHQSGGRSSAQEEEQCRGCGEADSCRSPMDDRRRGRRINQQTKNEEEEEKKRKEEKKTVCSIQWLQYAFKDGAQVGGYRRILGDLPSPIFCVQHLVSRWWPWAAIGCRRRCCSFILAVHARRHTLIDSIAIWLSYC